MKKITPIRFEGYMHSGGSTKPWRIIGVDVDANEIVEVPYVAKTFSTNNIDQSHSIGKEFVCNALASQFDLGVPEVCLVNLNDEDFKSTLPEDALQILSTKFQGSTFASELMNATMVNEQLKGPFDINDCANLFAFDCLIYNLDRGGWRNKPNLLMDDDGFILIDHELTFPFIDLKSPDAYGKLMENLDNNTWPSFYIKHLFYGRLKEHRGHKKHLFDTFEQSLMTLNIVHMQNVVNDLINNDVHVGASTLLINYLSALKQNSHKFRNILLSLIS